MRPCMRIGVVRWRKPPRPQMLLDATRTVIHEVDFGRFGVDGSTEGWCGAFVAVNAAAGVDVTDALSDVCVGARTCEVSLSPRPGGDGPGAGPVQDADDAVEVRRLTPKPAPAVSPRGDASRLKLTKKTPRAPLRTRVPTSSTSRAGVKFEAVNWAGENWRRVPGGPTWRRRHQSRNIAAMDSTP